MTSTITVSQAVDWLFCGKSNLIAAAKAAEVDPDILKRLVLERVKSSPNQAPLQLTLNLR